MIPLVHEVNGIVKKASREETCTKDREVKGMPTMDMIECERVAYVNEMQEYLQRLKQMNRAEAQKKSFENLVQSQIIYENGEFTEHYDY